MFKYLYIVFLIGVFSYYIYNNIMKYKKGEYNPYPFEKTESDLPFWKALILNLLIISGAFFLGKENRVEIILTGLFIYLIVFIVHIVVLNYLSYKKTQDRKIINDTLIYALTGIVLMVFLWRLFAPYY